LEEGTEKNGKSSWKFNSSLLRDASYVKEIQEVITAVADEYAALPYSRENLSKIGKTEIQFVIGHSINEDNIKNNILCSYEETS